MFSKELLTKIKALTNEMFGSEKFASEKLKDSEVEVKYSELVIGADVSQSSPDGDIAIEDGTHILDSGISFKTVDGKITEVIEAPAEEEVKEELAEEKEVEETKEEEVKEELATEDNSELLTKIEALEQEIAEIKASLQPKEDEAFTKLQGEVKAIGEILALLAKTPAEFSKVDNRNESIDSKNDRLKALADIISKK